MTLVELRARRAELELPILRLEEDNARMRSLQSGAAPSWRDESYELRVGPPAVADE